MTTIAAVIVCCPLPSPLSAPLTGTVTMTTTTAAIIVYTTDNHNDNDGGGVVVLL
ncbi:MAG: hypothetical protein MPK06_07385 [Alphaproteobacteria bacterium]|nr:hypothetical protein [Alphaproteobacteria bacterium]MDA8004838.1 hypothetical protein [Alphaproteobacteria bacterium]MDA8006336.1 hypothetical protein [Alphaproteobacteria bacterium]MDA8013690.1 hypothetical protein [Alphaproteobacteria bacterium]